MENLLENNIRRLKELKYDLENYETIESKDEDVQALESAIFILKKIEIKRKEFDIRRAIESIDTSWLWFDLKESRKDFLTEIVVEVVSILREEILRAEEAQKIIKDTKFYLERRNTLINCENLIHNIKISKNTLKIIEKIINVFEKENITYKEGHEILKCTNEVIDKLSKQDYI